MERSELQERLALYHEVLVDEGYIRRHAKGVCMAALTRFDEGVYGRCVKCQSKISKLRLEGNPTEVHCRDCEDHLPNRVKSAQSRAKNVTKFQCIPSESTVWWF